MNNYRVKWTEQYSYNKKRFKEVYGRKPTKEEIKMLRKGLIDLKLTIDPRHMSTYKRSIVDQLETKKIGNNNIGVLYDVE